MSTVSVIVPCYNYGRFLRQCVHSVLQQRDVEVAVLIIDDASSDDTAEVGSTLARADPRVEFRRHEMNQGHIATYNEGLGWASGDYTVLLSADDLLAPGALSRASRLMDEHPDVTVAYGAAVRFKTPEPPAIDDEKDPRWEIVPGPQWIEDRCRDGDNPVYSPTAVVRTDLQHQLGGYLVELPRSGDMEMWLRFAAYGNVCKLASVQAASRAHGANMDRTMFADPLVKLEQTKSAFAALFDRHGARIPDRERLKRLSDRALARHALWWIFRGLYKGEMEATPVARLVDFATSTYRGWSPLGDVSTPRAKATLVARLPHLALPFWDGLLRWPGVWLRVQRGSREAAIP